MEEINNIFLKEHFFLVKINEKWNKENLFQSIELPGLNYHHNSKESIKIYFDFIYTRIINKLNVDFYSLNEKNEFESMFSKLQLFSIHILLEYTFYGQIIEDYVNYEFGCYLKIVFARNKLIFDKSILNHQTS